MILGGGGNTGNIGGGATGFIGAGGATGLGGAGTSCFLFRAYSLVLQPLYLGRFGFMMGIVSE